ncbi:MAG TPA: class I SAM-dependent methyltransferase [Fontimonas sp.]
MEGTIKSGRSHASADVQQRVVKAEKIARLVGLDERLGSRCELLEIGTGSGVMAAWFAGRGCDVTSVDVVDERVAREGFAFKQVNGVRLPFADRSFDLVVSNHSIEHVGDHEAQQAHLLEMARVCRNDGTAYLAVPNRWMLVEPHYGLVFLSWLPRGLADFYVRLAGRGTAYDCRPLSLPELSRMLGNAKWRYEQQVKTAVESLIATERASPAWLRYAVRLLPDFTYHVLAPIFPTLIFVLRKS